MEIIWILIGAVAGCSLSALVISRLGIQGRTEQVISRMFDSLAADALRKNNESFLQLAKESLGKDRAEAKGDLESRKQAIESILKPLGDHLHVLEKTRSADYGSLEQLIKTVQEGQVTLEKETRNLTNALRVPHIGGKWGEITLRRVAELAGMVDRCDFYEQVSVEDSDKNLKRPDMVVHLPNGRNVVVDAKTPLNAYLNSIEALSDEERDKALDDHAAQVKARVLELSGKGYRDLFETTPEFVVLFLPGEPFLGAALRKSPDLLEKAFQSGVVIATPSTLIALLHAISRGWNEQKLAQNAREIATKSEELFTRMITWVKHYEMMGSNLDKVVKSYNSSVGSLENRVFPSARAIQQYLGKRGTELDQVKVVETSVRRFNDSNPE